MLEVKEQTQTTDQTLKMPELLKLFNSVIVHIKLVLFFIRIIAVGYEARACGVTRNMRGDDAKQKCPSITLVHVPEVRGKADLTKYEHVFLDEFVIPF